MLIGIRNDICNDLCVCVYVCVVCVWLGGCLFVCVCVCVICNDLSINAIDSRTLFAGCFSGKLGLVNGKWFIVSYYRQFPRILWKSIRLKPLWAVNPSFQLKLNQSRPKLISQQIRKRYCKTSWTNKINSPMSPSFLVFSSVLYNTEWIILKLNFFCNFSYILKITNV